MKSFLKKAEKKTRGKEYNTHFVCLGLKLSLVASS